SDVIFRISQLCTLILSEEQISYSSFTKYVENTLRKDYFTDSHIRRLMRDRRPSRALAMLMESLLDVRSVILDLARLSKIPYITFSSVGRIINREVRKGNFFDLFLERKHEPLFDRVSNPRIIRIVRSIQVPRYKRSIASLFLEFFRVLRYLHTIGLQMQDANALKRSLLILSLVHAELKWIIHFMEDEYLRRPHPDVHFTELIEGTVLSLTMELKKVMHRELLGTAALQQYELIFTHIQNSQGILLNSVQQIVFGIAHYFDPRLEGQEIFPDYVTRLDQSLKLRMHIFELRESVGHVLKEAEMHQLPPLIKKVEWFKISSMKYLMYKDWSEMDHFYHEIVACRTTGNMNFSLHRFHTFLTTLIREVNKRAILSSHPFEHKL
ncbi:MAG TPA: hypothetical protein VLR94_01800, partial [Acidobacteriota bacterium]|nr:hypothetical protein [Acidobacteriota bacterium]